MLTTIAATVARMESIADRIRFVIENAEGIQGASVKEFADLVGVTRSAVYQWLDGTTEPGPEILFNIEDKTKFRARWIVLGEQPKQLRIPAAQADEMLNIISERLEKAS